MSLSRGCGPTYHERALSLTKVVEKEDSKPLRDSIVDTKAVWPKPFRYGGPTQMLSATSFDGNSRMDLGAQIHEVENKVETSGRKFRRFRKQIEVRNLKKMLTYSLPSQGLLSTN